MEPHLEQLRKPQAHARRTVAPRDTRPRQTSIPARPRATREVPTAAVASGESPPIRDRGISLLAIFTATALLIVALVCLVGSVDRWWILIPVMVVHFVVTGAVLTVTVRLLDDGSGP